MFNANLLSSAIKILILGISAENSVRTFRDSDGL